MGFTNALYQNEIAFLWHSGFIVPANGFSGRVSQKKGRLHLRTGKEADNAFLDLCKAGIEVLYHVANSGHVNTAGHLLLFTLKRSGDQLIVLHQHGAAFIANLSKDQFSVHLSLKLLSHVIHGNQNSVISSRQYVKPCDRQRIVCQTLP